MCLNCIEILNGINDGCSYCRRPGRIGFHVIRENDDVQINHLNRDEESNNNGIFN